MCAIIAVNGFIALSHAPNKKLWGLLSAGVGLVLLSGSINAVQYGTDISGYYKYAAKMLSVSSLSDIIGSTRFEKGYTVYCYLITRLAGSAQAFLYIHSAIVTFLFFRFIYKNTNDFFMGVVLYISLGTWMFIFTAFRQSVAMGICLLVYDYLKEKKWVFASLFFILAITFHKTSVVFGIVFFLDRIKKGSFAVGFTVTLMLLTYVFRNYIVSYFSNTLDLDYGTNNSRIAALGGIISFAIYLLTFWLLHLSKQNGTLHPPDPLVILLGITGCGLYMLRFSVLAIERIAFYFLPAYIVLFPEAIRFEKDIRTHSLVYLAFVSLFIFLLYYRISHTMGAYIPFWS
jgi:hypothetical protein